MIRQPFHLVESSPWPITSAAGALTLATGLTLWFHQHTTLCALTGIMILLMSMYQWFRDISREGTYMGHHTSPVVLGLRLGMVLFIISEVAFFFSFFWAFFHSSLAPTPPLGSTWPPAGISPINPYSIPLLNTSILLASGVTVTWAHHAILGGAKKSSSKALLLTITLGIYFTYLQVEEYFDAPFSIADSVYGSTFFVATGFHGLHVMIGTTILSVSLLRLMLYHFSLTHHFGFEAAAWYWHFVDVVWIFLYICIYWWGS